MVPMNFDGFNITPGPCMASKGANAMDNIEDFNGRPTNIFGTPDGNAELQPLPLPGINNRSYWWHKQNLWFNVLGRIALYQLQPLIPLISKLILNYGYVEEMGRYEATKAYYMQKQACQHQT